MIGSLVAAAFALGMVSLGTVACAAPAFASRLYGVPAADAQGTAWVRARLLHAVNRDVEGALALVSAWRGSGHWQYGLQAASWLVASVDAAPRATTLRSRADV